MRNRSPLLLASLAVSLAACANQDDTSRVDAARAAIPTTEAVRLSTPGGSAGSTTQALKHTPGVGVQGIGSSGYAEFYTLTRALFDGVNAGTGWVLGTVWFIVNLPPSSVKDGTITWGPGSNALDPAEWQMVATETSPGTWDYKLEGRKKSDENGTWIPTLTGTGHAPSSAEHDTGTFHIDYDAANSLDPASLGASTNSGVADVTYQLATFPTTIEVVAHRSVTPTWFDVTVTRDADGGGRIDLKGHDDIEDEGKKDGNYEDFTMKSRWLSTGAGRADVTVSGGSLPASIGTISASECWDVDFARTYYADSANTQPASGDPTSCAFATTE